MSSLKQTLYILRRELSEYFSSPVFYVVAAAFHLLLGAIFTTLLSEMATIGADPMKRSGHIGELNISRFVLANLFDAANFLLLFIAPALTMRLFAEEKRSGSFELLVSTPTRDWSILLGKAGAAYVAVAALALSMAIYPWMASRFGAVEPGLAVTALLGLLLLGAAYVSAGVFASSLTDNQIIAAVAAFSILLLFALVGSMAPNSSGDWWGSLMRSFSFAHRSRNFYEGLLRLEDVLFFAFFAWMGLFATARVLEARRWRR